MSDVYAKTANEIAQFYNRHIVENFKSKDTKKDSIDLIYNSVFISDIINDNGRQCSVVKLDIGKSQKTIENQIKYSEGKLQMILENFSIDNILKIINILPNISSVMEKTLTSLYPKNISCLDYDCKCGGRCLPIFASDKLLKIVKEDKLICYKIVTPTISCKLYNQNSTNTNQVKILLLNIEQIFESKSEQYFNINKIINDNMDELKKICIKYIVKKVTKNEQIISEVAKRISELLTMFANEDAYLNLKSSIINKITSNAYQRIRDELKEQPLLMIPMYFKEIPHMNKMITRWFVKTTFNNYDWIKISIEESIPYYNLTSYIKRSYLDLIGEYLNIVCTGSTLFSRSTYHDLRINFENKSYPNHYYVFIKSLNRFVTLIINISGDLNPLFRETNILNAINTIGMKKMGLFVSPETQFLDLFVNNYGFYITNLGSTPSFIPFDFTDLKFVELNKFIQNI